MELINIIRKRKYIILLTAIVLITIISVFFIAPEYRYKTALNKINNNNELTSAIKVLSKITNYKDSRELMDKAKNEIKYQEALTNIKEFDWDKAAVILSGILGYKDVDSLITQVNNGKVKEGKYKLAQSKIDNKDYQNAINLLNEIKDYRDSTELKAKVKNELMYDDALVKINAKDQDKALNILKQLGDYRDSNELRKSLVINICVEELKKRKYEKTLNLLEEYNEGEDWDFQSSDEVVRALYYYASAIKENEDIIIMMNINPQYPGPLSDEIKKFFGQGYLAEYNIKTLWPLIYEKQKKSEELLTRPWPKVGMKETEARNSSWGEPRKINRTTTASGEHEQWVYSGDRYIYIHNGVVTAIQDFNF